MLTRQVATADDAACVTLGVTTLTTPPGTLNSLHQQGGLYMAPNGVAYVTPDVRKGVLPAMVSELLEARVLVKAAMKRAGDGNPTLTRMLNARQVAAS